MLHEIRGLQVEIHFPSVLSFSHLTLWSYLQHPPFFSMNSIPLKPLPCSFNKAKSYPFCDTQFKFHFLCRIFPVWSPSQLRLICPSSKLWSKRACSAPVSTAFFSAILYACFISPITLSALEGQAGVKSMGYVIAFGSPWSLTTVLLCSQLTLLHSY